jgi:hypothetical protein
VSPAVNGNSLANRRHVVAVLRLVVDADGRVEKGELVDTEARPLGRFANWRGLIRAIRTWLESQGQASARGSDPVPGAAVGDGSAGSAS